MSIVLLDCAGICKRGAGFLGRRYRLNVIPHDGAPRVSF